VPGRRRRDRREIMQRPSRFSRRPAAAAAEPHLSSKPVKPSFDGRALDSPNGRTDGRTDRRALRQRDRVTARRRDVDVVEHVRVTCSLSDQRAALTRLSLSASTDAIHSSSSSNCISAYRNANFCSNNMKKEANWRLPVQTAGMELIYNPNPMFLCALL